MDSGAALLTGQPTKCLMALGERYCDFVEAVYGLAVYNCCIQIREKTGSPNSVTISIILVMHFN